MSVIIDGLPLLDWLSLSAYTGFLPHTRRSAEDMVNRLSAEMGSPQSMREINVGKFRGTFYQWQAGTVFSGLGINQGKEQHIIQFHGYVAQVLQDVGWYDDSMWQASRMDVQVTLPFDGVTMREWIINDKNEKFRLVEGTDGTGTIYVGSKTSDRFWRIYTKRDQYGEMWTRFECQLDKKIAKPHAKDIKTIEDTHGLFVAEFGKLEKKLNKEGMYLSCGHADLMTEIMMDDVAPRYLKAEPRGLHNTTMQWLKKSVYPACLRLAETRYSDVRDLLMTLVKEMDRQYDSRQAD